VYNFGLRFIYVAFFLFYTSAFSQDLNTALNYYNQGDFASAKEILESYLESHPQDNEALYYAGKLEEEPERSIEYFKKIWESSSNNKKEEAAIELVYFYQAEGLNDSILELCSSFKNIFPQSSYLPQILWLESQAFFSSGKIEQALNGFKYIVEEYPYSPWAAWAQLGIGEIYFAQGELKKSLKEYNRVVDQFAETEAFPLALSGIYRAFESSNEKDKAILYLNLYKEKFPQGIDLESEVLSEEIRDSGKAEKLTGTKYTVQIGVFANKDNADRIVKKLKSRGYNPEESYKYIQKKRYYVIRVGSFNSLSEAQKLKEKLEKEEGEVYRIVIR
jgi:tetratricopeptide (TPR) repeat protein